MHRKRLRFPMKVQVGSVAVKLYRVQNHGRLSYTLSYFAAGKRQLKMFADFDKAYAEAKSKAIALSRGDLDALLLDNTDRQAYLRALDALRPTGTPLELAAIEYAEAFKTLGGRSSILEVVREFVRKNPVQLPSKMLPDAVNEMIDAKEKEGMSKVYLKSLRFYLRLLSEAFHAQLSSVTTGQLAEFLRSLDMSARSKNNLRQTMGTFFKYCRERGWLPRDHDGIELVPKFKEKPTNIEIFTPSEIASFLTHAKTELVPFLAIGAFAGLRSAEIERLDWKEIHLAERFIEVKAAKAKTASRRLVPISENLANWLASYAQSEGPVVNVQNVTKEIALLVKATNEGVRNAAKSERLDPTKAQDLHWKKNALRHSYISYRVADIQNVNQVALECGNSPAIIFKHYRELVRPAEAKTWFGVEPEADGKLVVIPKAAPDVSLVTRG